MHGANSTSATRAIAFIPSDNPLDGVYAIQCLQHIERRGYQLVAILRTWEQVLEALRADLAQVIVVARREHLDPDRAPRIEVVGGGTRDVSARSQAAARANARAANGTAGGLRRRRPNVID